MKWRPPDWKNPHRSRTIRTQYLDGNVITEPRDDEAVHAMIYEAGADAMLEALKAKSPYGVHGELVNLEVEAIKLTPTIPEYAKAAGWLVWIPDDDG